MKRIEAIENINTCRKIISILEGENSTWLPATSLEHLLELEDEILEVVSDKVLSHTKTIFNEVLTKCKPLLNGDMTGIAKSLKSSMSLNTFRNYVNGFPLNSSKMLDILNAVLPAYQDKKEKLLQTA